MSLWNSIWDLESCEKRIVGCDKRKEVLIKEFSPWDSHLERKDIRVRRKVRHRCSECSQTVWKSLVLPPEALSYRLALCQVHSQHSINTSMDGWMSFWMNTHIPFPPESRDTWAGIDVAWASSEQRPQKLCRTAGQSNPQDWCGALSFPVRTGPNPLSSPQSLAAETCSSLYPSKGGSREEQTESQRPPQSHPLPQIPWCRFPKLCLSQSYWAFCVWRK